MRTELEARLVFAAPSELLIATPLSSASQRLLGAYTSQSRGLRSQTASRERYSSGGAVAAVSTFYTHAGVCRDVHTLCFEDALLLDDGMSDDKSASFGVD